MQIRFSPLLFLSLLLLVSLVVGAPIGLKAQEEYTIFLPSVSTMSRQIVSIEPSRDHTCILTNEGGVKCWGGNSSGQIGDGTTTARSAPTDVVGLEKGVVALGKAKDFSVCAILNTGAAMCWGMNHTGQLGDGTTIDRSEPTAVLGLNGGVQAIASAWDHTCALTTAGGVKCWGNNDRGQLGNGTREASLSPVDVLGLTTGVQSIDVGSRSSCALMTAGGVKCWGYIGVWQGEYYLGDLNVEPVDVAELTSGVNQIGSHLRSPCALLNTGGVKCWGNNTNGQLGDGTTTGRFTVGTVTGLTSGVDEISVGANHACARSGATSLKCWGYNFSGQIGDGTAGENRLVPVAVKGLPDNLAGIRAGSSHTCALTVAGGALCWGGNYYGQLGDGTTTDSLVPMPIAGFGEY